MARDRSEHVTENTAAQWVVSGLIYLGVFAFFMWYHFVRGKPYSLFTANKCIAIAAAFSIGLSLSLGPLSRFFEPVARALPYRRTLGLTGAYMIVLHPVLSALLLRKKFPLEWYGDHWLSVVFCVPALALLLVIALHSYPSAVERLGEKRWLSLQRLAWLALALVLSHILFLGKMPGWIKWLRILDKPLPPGAFTTACFCLLVLLLKGAEVVRRRSQRGAIRPKQEGRGNT